MNVSWQAFSENFTGLELEDGGGRGTSGFLLFLFLWSLSQNVAEVVYILVYKLSKNLFVIKNMIFMEDDI